MTVVLVGLSLAAPTFAAVWCWATSPTYRTIRREWAHNFRTARADRRWARQHRISR